MDQIPEGKTRSDGSSVRLMLRRLTYRDIASVARIAAVSAVPVWSEKDFAYFFSQEAGVCIGAEMQTLVGFLVGLKTAGGELDIANIAVEPKSRRKGIATRMLRYAIEEFHPMQVTLEVRSDNHPAIELYKRFGFKAAGIRPRYYEGRVDALRMLLSL